MNLAHRCGGVSTEQVAEEMAANRSVLLERLRESCIREGEESTGVVCTQLITRLATYLDYFLPAYTRADLSARRHHDAYARASTSVFTLGAVAVIIVAGQYLFHLPHLLVLGEIACIGMILTIFHWGNRSRWHRTWVDCRYFAERVRCGMFVSFLAGKSAVSIAPQWSDRLVEGAWCNPEFQILMGNRPHPGTLSRRHLGVLRDFMITHWLEDQAAYHRSVAVGKMRKHKVISRIGETCFWLTLLAALLHMTSHGWRQTCRVDHVLADGLLTFVVIALPAIGTAMAGMRGHFEFKKIATRSHMIALHLESLIDEGRAAGDLAEFTLVVLRAEALMIQENAGWHLHTADKVLPSD